MIDSKIKKTTLIVIIFIALIIGSIYILLNSNNCFLGKCEKTINKSGPQTIELFTSGGIPYLWKYNVSDESVIRIEESSEVKENMPGGKVSLKYKIFPLKKGETMIIFNYEEITTNKSIETKKYKIIVKENLEMLIIKVD